MAKSRPGFVGARRTRVREREGAFTGTRSLSAPQHGKESKMPDEKLTGHLVLATSYSRTAYRRTTIGAAAFHFRVRNGNGWCHYAIVTRVRDRTGGSLLSQRRRREAESLGTRAIEVNRPCLKIRFQKNNQLSADPLISTYRSSFRLRTADATTELRFVLRSFGLLCLPSGTCRTG